MSANRKGAVCTGCVQKHDGWSSVIEGGGEGRGCGRVLQQFSCAIFLFAGEWRDTGIHKGGILRERRGEGVQGRDGGSGKSIKSCESLLIIYQFYSDPSFV